MAWFGIKTTIKDKSLNTSETRKFDNMSAIYKFLETQRYWTLIKNRKEIKKRGEHCKILISIHSKKESKEWINLPWLKVEADSDITGR
jgi:hypothetical protein